ncbi:hypothetical protein C1N53_05175 [Pontibacter sp. SGAir0037]|nr:hypothetical protein C1N53_05175 [Pontibacter sp. SGAir0037]
MPAACRVTSKSNKRTSDSKLSDTYLQPFSLLVVNAIGQQVKPIRHGLSSGTTIDFSGMADGMYLLVLTFPNGREIKRVIKIT